MTAVARSRDRPPTGRRRARAGSRRARRRPSARRDASSPTGSTSCVYAKRATGDRPAAVRRRRRPRRRHGSSASTRAATGPGAYWHALVPGIGAGQLYGYRGARAVGARARPAVRPDAASCSIRTAAASSSRRATGAWPPAARRRRARPDEERRRRPERLRLGGRPAARAGRSRETVIYEAHVRGLHRATRAPASASRAARHVRRASSRRSRTCVDLGITAVELLPVFQFDAPGVPAGPGQLLGLPAGLVLRAARRRTASRPRPARPGRRVPRHGQGPPPGRHRGHPRRRLQPHRRGRRRRPDALLPRPRQHDLLHARRRAARGTPTTAAAATRSTPTTRSSAG